MAVGTKVRAGTVDGRELAGCAAGATGFGRSDWRGAFWGIDRVDGARSPEGFDGLEGLGMREEAGRAGAGEESIS